MQSLLLLWNQDGKSDYTVSPIAPSRNDLRAICKELDTVKRYSNIMPCEGRFIGQTTAFPTLKTNSDYLLCHHTSIS